MRLWNSGMLAYVFEHVKIVFELDEGATPLGFVGGVDRFVFEQLTVEGFAGFEELVVLVDVLDDLLESNGDDEADGDGGDGDDEVFPGVGGFVGWVDVEHGLGPLTLSRAVDAFRYFHFIHGAASLA